MVQTKTRYYRHDHDVLIAIVASHKVRGHGPTYREIQDAIRIKGHSTVIRSVGRLEAAGYLRRGAPYERQGLVPTPNGLAAAGFYMAEERTEELDLGV